MVPPPRSERIAAEEFLDRYAQALVPVIEGYRREHRRYATVAVGCTGGKHRSVCLAKEFADFISRRGYAVTLGHRDISRR